MVYPLAVDQRTNVENETLDSYPDCAPTPAKPLSTSSDSIDISIYDDCLLIYQASDDVVDTST